MDSRALLVLRWASQLIVRAPMRRAHQMRRTAVFVSSHSRGRVRTLGGLVGEGRHPLPMPGRLRPVNRRRLSKVPRTGGYVNYDLEVGRFVRRRCQVNSALKILFGLYL